MIRLMKATSRSAKQNICRTHFGVLAFFAFSGMNNAASVLRATSESPVPLDGACTIASPGQWVARPVPRTVYYFIPSAMTGFTVYVFLSPNRVFLEAFAVLEPDDGKLSCPVLRGPGGRKAAWLLDLPFLWDLDGLGRCRCNL